MSAPASGNPASESPDVVLIGAGIMSATLGTVLKELEPALEVVMFETLEDCALESSRAWNNAGTGHAANCELNYTPRSSDGSIDISRALQVNTEFDLSRQLWSHLVTKGAIGDPRAFIEPCPHMSFVWGEENVAFLRDRYRAMSAHHCYHGMEYSEEHARHRAKVYGMAAVGSPPMSVPHLDTRTIAGKRSLLFGPYAGFSSKFLKHGAYSDLFRSIEPGNVLPMLAVARDDWRLAEYLIGQVLQTGSHQFKVLEQFFPQAQRQDWREAVAGQRVETIKPDPEHTGVLEFGTELVGSADNSIVALLGASPGASTAAFIAIEVLEKRFENQLAGGWRDRLKTIIPTYGIDLTQDAAACRDTRAKTAPVLGLTNV
jgi:L-2-hydroxyglutarate oxidase LhgO